MFPDPESKFTSSKSNCTVLNKWHVISVTWSNKKNLSNCWSNGIKVITFTSGDTKDSDYSFIGDLGRLNGSYKTYLSGCIDEKNWFPQEFDRCRNFVYSTILDEKVGNLT